MKKCIISIIIGSILTMLTFAEDTMCPTAIFAFQERGAGVKGYGEKVSDILFASLVAQPELYLVDRADMQKMLEEQELNLSGMVTPGQAIQIGQLTGAKILVTGSVIEAGKTMYVVAKIIGTETSRVLGESVKGNTRDELAPLVESLAEEVAATILAKSGELVAHPVKMEDRVAALNATLGDAKRPTVLIRIREHHVGREVIDPAAQTEFTLLCRDTGFEVIDEDRGSVQDATILIDGEGFSEFGMRRGNLVSVKSRLEIKAINLSNDTVIATDRQTAVVVDIAEELAGKAALQKAAAEIAERMLPKLVTKQ